VCVCVHIQTSEFRLFHLCTGSNVVSADNMAATVKASDKQPWLFASIKVLAKDGSNGSSAKNQETTQQIKRSTLPYTSA